MMRKRFHDLGKRFPSALHADFLFLLGQMYFRFTHDFAQKEKTDEFMTALELGGEEAVKKLLELDSNISTDLLQKAYSYKFD